MAYTFDVCEMRDPRSLNYQGTKDSLSTQYQTQYRVIVGATAGEDVRDVSAFTVAQRPEIPLVNRSVYFFRGKIVPFLVCSSKTVLQDRQNAAMWTVTCGYSNQDPNTNQEDETTQQEQDPPAALTDITPREEVVMNEREEYLWVDYSDPGATNPEYQGPKPYRTPIDTFWDEPLIERAPLFTIKITQYEDFISYEELIGRKLRVNQGTYRTRPEYSWLIEQVDALETVVQLAAGPTECAQVTYTITLNDRYILAGPQAGTHVGWREPRALITWFYKDSLNPPDDEKKPFVDGKLKTETTGFVDKDGLIHNTPTNPPGLVLPYYEIYEPQKVIDFSTFLQV